MASTFINFQTTVFYLIIIVTKSQAHPPAPPDKIVLKPIQSWLHKPCDFKVYKILFEEEMTSEDSLLSPTEHLISLLTEGQFNYTTNEAPPEVKQFGEYLDQLCLVIDDQLTIDVHAFDCLPDLPPGAWKKVSSCHCGNSMSHVDMNVPQPESNPGELKTYSVVIGLDRRLEAYGGECLSGHNGHCNTTLKIPLNCGPEFHCENVGLKTGPFRNKVTSATYGICRKNVEYEVDEVDGLNLSLRINGSASLHFTKFFKIIKIVLCFCTLKYCLW